MEEVIKLSNTSAVSEPSSVQDKTIPATHLSVDISESQNREVSTQSLISAVPVSTVLATTPIGVTHNVSTTNVIQMANTEASSVTAAPVSGKKRNRRRKRNSQKKICVDEQ